MERVAGDLEDIFAGVEEEELVPTLDSSQRKRKPVEESSSVSETITGKKRVALGGSKEAEKRPLHMKKPSKMSPAQAMHDRYKKIQALKQQQLLEKKLTELTEDTPSTSTSGTASTSSSMGGKKRVAHAAVSAPVEKN